MGTRARSSTPDLFSPAPTREARSQSSEAVGSPSGIPLATRPVAFDSSITLSPVDGGRLRSPSGTLAIAAPIEQHGHALDLALVPGGDQALAVLKYATARCRFFLDHCAALIHQLPATVTHGLALDRRTGLQRRGCFLIFKAGRSAISPGNR